MCVCERESERVCVRERRRREVLLEGVDPMEGDTVHHPRDAADHELTACGITRNNHVLISGLGLGLASLTWISAH